MVALSERGFSPLDIKRTVNTTTICTSTAFSCHLLSIVVRIFEFSSSVNSFVLSQTFRLHHICLVPNGVKTRRNALFTEQEKPQVGFCLFVFVSCAILVNLSLSFPDDLERITVTVCVEMNKVAVEFVVFHLPTFSSTED